MAIIADHPALLEAEFRRILRQLLACAAAGAVWGSLCFYFSLRPPHFLGLEDIAPLRAGVYYSWYACVHSFYVALAVALAYFLASRGWLRAAALACAIPGPGFLFNLPLIPFAWHLHRRLGEPEWRQFFEWRMRFHPVNDLTDQRRRK
ncbi:MAG: hypothetical protein K1X75_03975 [Leptospirales bacterium]|nr:hypothetical protein [Leptospirales bacterium]